nr:hypothetical protein GCM10020093_094430 [Planobispora longispora]
MHEAINESPGLRLVKTFGPVVGDPYTVNTSTWFNQPYMALEVWEVEGAAEAASTIPAGEPLRVTGGPEALLAMADLGLLRDDRPILLGDDGAAAEVPAEDTVVTDTLRRREVAFSELRFASSPTLTATEEYRRPAAVHDLLDPGWSKYLSVAKLKGVASVTASSSASDITALPDGRDPAHHPFAALDGDSRTSWRSDGWSGAVGEWIEVKFTSKITMPHLAVAFSQFLGPAVTEVEVETAAGKLRHPVANVSTAQLIPVPAGATDRLRLSVTKVAWRPKSTLGTRVGITELAVPGLLAARTVAVPTPAVKGGDPRLPAHRRRRQRARLHAGVVRVDLLVPARDRGEEPYGFNRTITSPGAAERVAEGQAILSDPGTANHSTTFPGIYPHVTASSTLIDHAATLGRAAFDGDPKTIWYAGALDAKPTLTIDFGRKTSLDRIKVIYPELLSEPAPCRSWSGPVRPCAAVTSTRTATSDSSGSPPGSWWCSSCPPPARRSTSPTCGSPVWITSGCPATSRCARCAGSAPRSSSTASRCRPGSWEAPSATS